MLFLNEKCLIISPEPQALCCIAYQHNVLILNDLNDLYMAASEYFTFFLYFFMHIIMRCVLFFFLYVLTVIIVLWYEYIIKK